MATASALIQTAFTELRVYSPDTDMDDQEQADALSRLNAMMASMATDIAMLGAATYATATLAAPAYPLTVGPSEDVDMVRPMQVLGVSYGLWGDKHQPLASVSWPKLQEYRARGFADISAPVAYHYSPDDPGKLWLVPEPSMGQVTIQALTPRYQWASLETDVDLPPGLQLAVELGLAVMMAGQFQISAGEELIKRAESALANWMRVGEN